VTSVTTPSQAWAIALGAGTGLDGSRDSEPRRRWQRQSGQPDRAALACATQRFGERVLAGHAFHHARGLHRGQEHFAWTAQRRAGSESGERTERKARCGERERRR
jgi:hypothetical protein